MQIGAAILLLAVSVAGGWWWLRRPAPVVPPLPGAIEDPEVRGAVERARQKVLDMRNEAAAWGVLGMTLEAHLYEVEADRCFAEAARLDPADARWPYFRGLYALQNDPDHAVPLLRQAASKQSSPETASLIRLRLAEGPLARPDVGEAAKSFGQA